MSLTKVKGEPMSDFYELYKRRAKELGYGGCRNCKHQIEPLRGCEWLEKGGDGRLHIICPKWERRE